MIKSKAAGTREVARNLKMMTSIEARRLKREADARREQGLEKSMTKVMREIHAHRHLVWKNR